MGELGQPHAFGTSAQRVGNGSRLCSWTTEEDASCGQDDVKPAVGPAVGCTYTIRIQSLLDIKEAYDAPVSMLESVAHRELKDSTG